MFLKLPLSEKFIMVGYSDSSSLRFTSLLGGPDIRDVTVATAGIILMAITRSIPDDIATLRLRLEKELETNAEERVVWEAAKKEFQELKATGLYAGINQPEFPDEYHIVLISYVYNGFYAQFNRATYMLKDIKAVRGYPYKVYFKFLLLSIMNMPGYGNPLHKDTKLYRGVLGNFQLKIGQKFAFQHFVSTSTVRSTAEGYSKKNSKNGEKRTIFIIENVISNCTSLLHHPPEATNNEVLLWPLEGYVVTEIEAENDCQVVHLQPRILSRSK